MIELDPCALATALTPSWMLRIHEFDDLEIEPCMVVSATADGEVVEPCDPHDAHFWTVYGHWATGGVDAFEDFATEAEAMAFAQRLRDCYPHLRGTNDASHDAALSS
jgi:hypothetical protein